MLSKVMGKKRFIISVPDIVARIQAKIFQLLPKPLLTEDQLEILKFDNICSGKFSGYNDLAIYPKSVETILSTYMFSKKN
jgi:NADH dehydrogenase